jgi:hypothetical protein
MISKPDGDKFTSYIQDSVYFETPSSLTEKEREAFASAFSKIRPQVAEMKAIVSPHQVKAEKIEKGKRIVTNDTMTAFLSRSTFKSAYRNMSYYNFGRNSNLSHYL